MGMVMNSSGEPVVLIEEASETEETLAGVCDVLIGESKGREGTLPGVFNGNTRLEQSVRLEEPASSGRHSEIC